MMSLKKIKQSEVRQISGQYDNESIIVYQAYNNSIANFAVEHQYSGGSFQLGRMTWIKPNFLWMMHRSGWASKENQERVLAIKISRSFFEELLFIGVLTSYDSKIYKSEESWKNALQTSEVRIQWDPAYNIRDVRQSYKAIQIGVKGDMSERYSKDEIQEIIDITEYVHTQKRAAKSKDLNLLKLPEEKIYEVRAEIKSKTGAQ